MTAPDVVPSTEAILVCRKMIDRALDARNKREFHRHAAHLKSLINAARRRAEVT